MNDPAEIRAKLQTLVKLVIEILVGINGITCLPYVGKN
jgi:hypothetical protein